jgi:transcriptional regulator with XRE-family HTH domain
MGQKFGEFFRDMRAKRRISLREFCVKNAFDPGNISKLERGLFPPPESQERLKKYARALGIKAGSDDWYEFFDLAAAEQGRIPQDVLSDGELIQHLPVLFRSLRGQPVDDDALNDLVERIRRS